MNKNTNNKKVFVGVSGGVDSSVALALLKEEGYEVTGVFIRTWQPDWTACTWREERRDAIRVCAHLDVPFVELNLEKEYKEGVADYMIHEYQQGRTPNPDVMCNREVKFGGFLKWALDHGADYVATGHYAARRENPDGSIELLRGSDSSKDQSYFLWTLTQEELQHILFPLGDMEKSQVRKRAEKYHLPTATKKDSQGICFIGEIDMKEFLSHFIEEREGKVLDVAGKVIGTHKGALFYTISERHGFHIDAKHKGTDDKPYYVISKDIRANTLTVSQNPLTEAPIHKEVKLENIIDNQGIFEKGNEYEAQIRSRGEVKKIRIESLNSNDSTMTISFAQNDYTIAPGQSVVMYDQRRCLGGGIVV